MHMMYRFTVVLIAVVISSSGAELQTRIYPASEGLFGSEFYEKEMGPQPEDFFRGLGVEFGEDASARFVPGLQRLIVKNTAEQIAKIDIILNELDVLLTQALVHLHWVEMTSDSAVGSAAAFKSGDYVTISRCIFRVMDGQTPVCPVLVPLRIVDSDASSEQTVEGSAGLEFNCGPLQRRFTLGVSIGVPERGTDHGPARDTRSLIKTMLHSEFYEPTVVYQSQVIGDREGGKDRAVCLFIVVELQDAMGQPTWLEGRD